jgi:hypothetical protein
LALTLEIGFPQKLQQLSRRNILYKARADQPSGALDPA